MIYLSSAPTSAAVKGFWAAVALLGVSMAAIIYRVLLPHPLFALGCLMVVAAFILLGVFRPRAFQAIYKNCSGIIRHKIIPIARQWILGVVFFFVILPNRPFGRRTSEQPSTWTETAWIPKEIHHLVGGSRGADIATDEKNLSWLAMLTKWIQETRSWWVISLVPFMLLLSLLNVGDRRNSRSDETYTLF